MKFTAEMIAAFLNGEVCGDKNATVGNVAKIEEGKPGDLSFLSNPKYEHFIYTSNASIIIVAKEFEPKESVAATLIKVENPYSAFSALLDLYVQNKPKKKGISAKADIAEETKLGADCYVGAYTVIEPGTIIGDGCSIYPNCYIGDNVRIGNNVTIYSGVNIYETCVIKDNVIIHSGAVIGADGFGFAPEEGRFKKIPQIGNVILEEDVEIGANTCVDRATMGSTIVKRGTKLDNLIQIAHNVVIGENCVAASQVGIAGSTKVGNNCMFGGQVGIAGHLIIADDVQMGSQSGASNSLKTPGMRVMGTPAWDARSFARSFAILKKLPDLSRKIDELEKKTGQIESALNSK